MKEERKNSFGKIQQSGEGAGNRPQAVQRRAGGFHIGGYGDFQDIYLQFAFQTSECGRCGQGKRNFEHRSPIRGEIPDCNGLSGQLSVSEKGPGVWEKTDG